MRLLAGVGGLYRRPLTPARQVQECPISTLAPGTAAFRVLIVFHPCLRPRVLVWLAGAGRHAGRRAVHVPVLMLGFACPPTLAAVAESRILLLLFASKHAPRMLVWLAGARRHAVAGADAACLVAFARVQS